MHESTLFLEILLLFGAATLVATLCHYLKLPTIVGFIIAGVAVGPSGFSLVSSLPNADGLAETAVIFLMFTIGLEFSFKRLIDLRREFLRLGLLQVCLTVMLVAVTARGLAGSSINQSIFLGFLVALSSTALVMKLLQDSRDVETPYGKQCLSILLFQDLAVIPMMLAVPLLAQSKAGEGLALDPATIGRTLLTVLGVLGSLWVLSRYVVPHLLDRVVRTRSREIFFSCVLFLCLGIAYLFELGGLSLGLGAFAAGMLVSEGPYGRQVTGDIVPLRDIFLGLFFISVGMLLDLRFVASHFLTIVALCALFLMIKGLVLFVTAAINRTPVSVAAIVALMLNQIGEFSFILASRGADVGLLTKEETQYFLSVSVLSMIFTPFLFRLAPRLALAQRLAPWKIATTSKAAQGVRDSVKASQKRSSAHTVIIGFGIAGQNMAAAMDALKIPYKALELNYESVKSFKRRGVDIHFGDATRAEVLEHVGIEEARLVVIAVSGAKLLPAIVTAVRSQRPDVQIIVRAQYLRDLETMPKDPQIDIVVAEIETSIELLARALKVYGVASEEIRSYMTQARTQLGTYSQIASTLQSPTLNLPSWEALSSIKPLRIGENDAAVSRSLADLDLPRATGTSVVSVFRVGLGTTVPDGAFVLRAGDVAHIIGSPENLAAAERVLRGVVGASR